MGKSHETRHFISPDTGERLKESGKQVSVKNTILVRTVRDAVFAIFEGKKGLKVKQYLDKKKPINLEHPQKELPIETRKKKLKFPKDKSSERSGQNIKNRLHSALEVVGINGENTDNKITTAMHTMAKQYENMDPTRLMHRMETTRSVGGENISKLERDIRFVLGISHLFGKQGYEAMIDAIEGFFDPSKNLNGLTSKSSSFFALNKIIQTGKQKLTGAELKRFKGILYQTVKYYKKR